MKTLSYFRSMIAVSMLVVSMSSVHAGELHVFTSDQAGFNTHSVWYDDGKEVTVIDTQFTPELAKQVIKSISTQTKSPITRLVITHPNPDKFNGIAAFHQIGAESISSKKTADAMLGVDQYKRYFWITLAKAFTEDNYPKIEPVKTVFSVQKKIKLKSGETLSLIELKSPGISSTQTVVRIDKTGDLIVGDLVHSKNHAWLEGGIVDGKPTPNLAGWKRDLTQLLSLGKGKVYGGRGEFLPVAQAVSEQIAYLDKAEEIVNNYIRNQADHSSELMDAKLKQKHFLAIQEAFVKAFPDYAMPELIGYSIYGLVQQKLAK